MGQGFYGFPRILDIVRATTFKAIGKTGATNGAALAGGTASGAPSAPAGPFDQGDVIVDATGSLWICTVAGTSQSSPGTFVQAGFANPLSTRGDLMVQGASSTTRLALGSTNQVLTSNGTDVAWAASPASAGGAMTQIAQVVVGAGGSTTIAFSSIPATYTDLMLGLLARGDTAANFTDMNVQFNADTGSNYDWAQWFNANAGAISVASGAAATSIRLFDIPAASATSGKAAGQRLHIPNYASTTFWKVVLAETWLNADALYTGRNTGDWRSTAAITSITLLLAAGKFAQGSTVTLWGLS